MEAVGERVMTVQDPQPADLFGNYKAEWLGERIFEFFRTPAYFPDIERARPCVLIGGRGTGKTTVLRTLSYEGKFALSANPASVPGWPYYGFYYRVNTNRVTAFQGPELTTDRWSKLFGHYINLTLCQQVVRFLLWHREKCPGLQDAGAALWSDVGASLCVGRPSTIDSLQEAIRSGLTEFEAMLNNLRGNQGLQLSLQGAPIDLLIGGIKKLPHFRDKGFYFLIDEYENLSDSQQVVMNTLLKHASEDYTFKIGVRELGWRRRYTLSDTEELTSPADYVRVDIADRLNPNEFDEFARQVCDARLVNLMGASATSIKELFPSIPAEEEAELLGSERLAARVRSRLSVSLDSRIAREAGGMSDLDLLLVSARAEQKGVSEEQVMRDRRSSAAEWRTYVDNYRHAILFRIADPKAPITKLYCGWSTFASLASSNIRNMLELVDYTFREHSRSGGGPGEPFSWKSQTRAAQAVGRKNLFELEGVREGALLFKLAIGLGRMFQIMARQGGRAPEQNQFSLTVSEPVPENVQRLLTNAVMHSALIRMMGSKLNAGDARSYDYALHPILSAFFGISHRRKRKIIIDPTDLQLLVQDPQRGMDKLLDEIGASATNEPLPRQLQLFEGLLNAGD